MMDPRELRRIALQRIEQGEQLKMNAGYSGAWNDGGGQAMIDEAKAFLAGLERQLPQQWEQFVADAARKEEDERSEYLRLKAKYEGKPDYA